MRGAVRIAAVLAGLVVATPAPAATPGEWSGGGPPAGVVGLLTVDPVDPDIVYGGGFTAVYRSDNGAGFWQRLPLPVEVPAPVFGMAVDPAAHQTVYLQGGDELFRSGDSARTWVQLEGFGQVSVFALLPGSPPALLVATYENGIQRSDDGGITWEASSAGLADPNAVYGLVPAPSDPKVVYLLAGESVYRSTDGGRSWAAVGVPAEIGFVTSLVVDPSDPHTLYAAGSTAVFRSTDGGGTWSERSNGLALGPDSFITGMAAGATQPTTLYVLTDRALFRSIDAGGEWSLVNDDDFNTVPPWTIAVDPADATHLYRASGLGVFVSHDGGETFEPAGEGLPGLATQVVAASSEGVVYAGLIFAGIVSSVDGGSTWRQGGGDAFFESVQAITAESGAGGRVYAGSYGGVFLRSEDQGLTWESVGLRLPHAPIWAIAVNPGQSGRVLAATEVGVYRSGSAGEAWRRSSQGLPNTGARSLAFAESAPNVVYAGLDRDGVFRSTDGGRSWKRAGLGRLTVISLAVDPRQPKVVYAATRSSGAFRSDDGGRTWKRLAATGLTGSVVLDPAAPDTVLLASGSRVLRSTNRGANFVRYGRGLPSRSGTPLDAEAFAPLTVTSLAAIPGGAFAATWGGVYGVTYE